MQGDRPISVLILYTHPLLGEGLAEMLAADPSLDVVAIPAGDAERTECALATSPQVIIFERGNPDRAVEILERVPNALIIDVGIGPGPTFTYRRDEISAWPDALIEAIHGSSSRRTAGAPTKPPREVASPS